MKIQRTMSQFLKLNLILSHDTKKLGQSSKPQRKMRPNDLTNNTSGSLRAPLEAPSSSTSQVSPLIRIRISFLILCVGSGRPMHLGTLKLSPPCTSASASVSEAPKLMHWSWRLSTWQSIITIRALKNESQ